MTCTVVIPCRNRHDRIVRAVSSALSVPVVTEVIVVDDRSSPPIEPALFGDARVRVVPNALAAGAQGARVTGARAASAGVILFLDSDDLLVADGVMRLYERLRADEELALVYGDFRAGARRLHVLPLDGHCFRSVLKNLSLCPFSGLMVRAALVPWSELDLTLPAWQDDDFVLTVAERHRIAFVEAVVAEITTEADSISRSRRRQLAGLRQLLGKWRPAMLRELGRRRLALWRLRELALVCDARGEESGPAAALLYRVLGSAIRGAVRPFFDRIYV